MTPPYWLETSDWHTSGEPFRIVPTLPSPSYLPPGATVHARRLALLNAPTPHPLDTLRRTLCHEPRGHAAMYGGFVVPPNDSGAHLGVLFWHAAGFSTACGHGTIALGYWAVSSGLVGLPPGSGDGAVDVVVDVPSGRVVARVAVQAGKPVHADFVNVASYVLAAGVAVAVPSRAMEVVVDLGFGGAVYAAVDAGALGLAVEAGASSEFARLGREIKAALGERGRYAGEELYGVIFFTEDDEGADEGVVRQTNVTVFADGQVDRSPCGSGTCARLAMLFAQGRVGPGRSKLVHRSIVGTTFEADVLSEEKSPVSGGGPACIARVRGQANLVGRMSFYIDHDDPVFPGFLLG
jgi:trans-L-3-hydroxyproline dehydratase